jgi:hypothetical protein
MKYIKIAFNRVVFVALIAFQAHVVMPDTLEVPSQTNIALPSGLSNWWERANNFGAQFFAPVIAGYEHDETAKQRAASEIIKLTGQQNKLQPSDENYAASMADLNDKIRQQKLITGQAWSTERRLSWTAAALLGAALMARLFLPGIDKLIPVKKQEEIVDAARSAFENFTDSMAADDKSAKGEQQRLWDDYQKKQKNFEQFQLKYKR